MNVIKNIIIKNWLKRLYETGTITTEEYNGLLSHLNYYNYPNAGFKQGHAYDENCKLCHK